MQLAVLFLLCHLLPVEARRKRTSASRNDSPAKVRATVAALSESGQFISLVDYLEEIENMHGTLVIDDEQPSLYNHLGVAYHIAQRVQDSEMAFKKCVDHNPRDTRCWMNLGEAQLHQFKIEEGLNAYTQAVNLGDITAPARLLRAKGWSNNWQGFESLASQLEQNVKNVCFGETPKEGEHCMLEGTSGLAYMEVPDFVHRETAKELPSAKESSFQVDESILAPYWTQETVRSIATERTFSEQPRLKVGLISSDFGVHPVATLLRGMIQFINISKIELFCFALNDELSWWGTNISRTVEHFVPLSNMNTQDAATEIAARGIEVLVDLNGHTLHSGIGLMAHRPSPVQVSFLGFPTTTGASFIDYYMGDPVALPAEARGGFLEQIAYMPPSCIANDYAQMRGGVTELTGSRRSDRALLRAESVLDPSDFLFMTLSNFQKISPEIFHVWMNILHTVTDSKMLFVKYQGYNAAILNLKANARMFGVDESRVVLMPQAPWIDHLTTKTSVDMILDTPTKNGHTTGLDGLWAGIPTMSIGGGRLMEQRAAESFAANFESYTGIAFSFKEYEDIAIEYARNKRKMKLWRGHIERKRLTETLYDTQLWTRHTERLLQVMWEVAHYTKPNGVKPHHVLSLPPKGPPKILEVHQILDEDNDQTPGRKIEERPKYLTPLLHERGVSVEGSTSTSPSDRLSPSRKKPKKKTESSLSPPSESKSYPLPANFFEAHQPLLLNIGGIIKKEGWVMVNSQPSSYGIEQGQVEVIRHLHDLHGFPNSSVDALYSSHSLEHVPVGDGTFEAALREWERVLKPGGLLLVAVPDLKMMARLLLDDSLEPSDRWFVSKMIYGAQSDEWDYHSCGFDEHTLPAFLHMFGFCDIERVGNFNLFEDTSNMVYKGYPISLNIAAKKCRREGDEELYLDHAADPYVPFVRPYEV